MARRGFLAACPARNERFLEAGNGLDLQRGPDRFLDGPDHLSVVFGDEGESLSLTLRPTSTPDPVRVGLCSVGDVEVDDMRDLCDVDASGGNVRSDQDVEGALSKAVHGPVALVLRHIALKGNGSVTVLDQLLCQLPCSALGPCEDDGRFEIVLAKQMAQHLDLSFFPDRIKRMFNRAGGYGVVDLSNEGVDQHLLGQPTDLARHRCGEQQILAASGQMRDDALDIGQETHVKHVICFIKDQGVDPRQIDKSATEQIEQPSRARTDHIDLVG